MKGQYENTWVRWVLLKLVASTRRKKGVKNQIKKPNKSLLYGGK